MRQAFANFARDPNGGLVKDEGWPALTTAQNTVMVLGLNDTLATVEDATVWNTPCYTQYGELSHAPGYRNATQHADLASVWSVELLRKSHSRSRCTLLVPINYPCLSCIQSVLGIE